MPSRKKLKQSRKAKRAATKGIPCSHRGRPGRNNCSNFDLNAADKLVVEFFNALDRGESLPGIVRDTYDKYNQFGVIRKEFFREIILSHGTEICAVDARNMDLTKVSSIWDTLPFVLMTLTIEVGDKHGGALNDNITGEIRRSFDDIINCTRKTVRFFHRRNSCDCLKEIYYKLKESTKRTSLCYYCHKNFDIRELSRCERCNVAQFCSYECAVAYWPSHKEQCKLWRGCQSL